MQKLNLNKKSVEVGERSKALSERVQQRRSTRKGIERAARSVELEKYMDGLSALDRLNFEMFIRLKGAKGLLEEIHAEERPDLEEYKEMGLIAVGLMEEEE